MTENKKKKSKKLAKSSLIISVCAVLISVWLVLSTVFCAIVMNATKNNVHNTAQKSFERLVDRIDTNVPVSYDFVNQYINITKCHLDFITTGKEEVKITCGADGLYDEDMQIVAYIPNKNNFLIMDTDKSIYTTFYCRGPKIHLSDQKAKTPTGVPRVTAGLIDYDSFIESMEDWQYFRIREHLNKNKDATGHYYELICTEYYYDVKHERIIPKEVALVETKESHIWYAEDYVIELFDLAPKDVDNLPFGVIDESHRNVIPGQFFMGTFSSGGLIEDPYAQIDFNSYDPYKGIVEKVAPFTYIYNDFDTVTIKSPTLNGQYFSGYSNYLEHIQNTGTEDISIRLKFAKRINVLQESKNILIIGTSLIFIFLFFIALILITTLWKIMNTQIEEEEKRREITNALAHDIKTPLFIISGYAQNLKENLNTDKREHYCDRIIDRTKEVNDLVHKMLDFLKLETFEQKLYSESIDIAQLIKLSIKDYSTLPDNKSLSTQFNERCTISADRALISRAVAYLLENAVKYSDKNTNIDIVLTKDSLSISNKCSNISTKDIPHLTEPYYRVEKNRESKGNGLGLSIVQSIVDMHNFKLDIKLQDNVITFRIVFHN